MAEIKFRLEGGEPACEGIECPDHPGRGHKKSCLYAEHGDPDECVPGICQQRDRANAKLQTIRTLIDEEEWNSDFRDVLLAELGDGK